MPKNFNSLRTKMSPAAQERSRRLAANYRSGMALDELRQARDMTQVHLAKILKVNQAAVSKLERRADMYVSTLHDFVKPAVLVGSVAATFIDAAFGCVNCVSGSIPA